jgi:hypothetical protein
MQSDAEVEEPKGKPTLSTLVEKLRLMVAGATQEQMNNVEAAIADREIAAGKQAALNACKTAEERADLMERYSLGELPTQEEIEAGLQLKNFSVWKRIRDDWLGYDLVTEKLARQVAAEDFSGLRFGTPKEKHTDSRISISALAKQPDAEVERVLNACLDNIEKNITMENSTTETRLGVRRIIEQEVLGQLEQAREQVRTAVLAAPKEKGAVFTPEQKAAQLTYAKLFSAPALNLKEMVERVAKKSTLQRLLPSISKIVQQVLDTPRVYQGNMTEAFTDEFVKRITKAYSVDEAEVSGLRKAVAEAFGGRLKEASHKAYDEAVAKMTPRQKEVLTKPMLDVIERQANAGVFDVASWHRATAKAHGWNVPSDEKVDYVKRLAQKYDRLRELTPTRKRRVREENPGLTDEQMAQKLEYERQKKEVSTARARTVLLRRMAAEWAQFTRLSEEQNTNGWGDVATFKDFTRMGQPAGELAKCTAASSLMPFSEARVIVAEFGERVQEFYETRRRQSRSELEGATPISFPLARLCHSKWQIQIAIAVVIAEYVVRLQVVPNDDHVRRILEIAYVTPQELAWFTREPVFFPIAECDPRVGFRTCYQCDEVYEKFQRTCSRCFGKLVGQRPKIGATVWPMNTALAQYWKAIDRLIPDLLANPLLKAVRET